MKFPAVLVIALFFSYCRASDVIMREHVWYNFDTEGFLSPDVLQTIGRSTLKDSPRSLEGEKRHCLERALHQAERRALTVFLHTYFNLPPRKGSLTGQPGEAFRQDYPSPISERDYLRAEVDFKPLLDQGFIALQDSRSMEECTVVYRIVKDDLSREVRSMVVTFQLDVKPRPGSRL